MNRFFVYKILFIIFLCSNLYAKNELIESQPEILFKFDKLNRSQENLALQVKFNKAVFLLNKNQYKESIELFKQTAKILEIPSYLNIGIAYYKLNSIDNAIIYLNKIYENRVNASDNTYSYMAACYYLYQISKDNKYLDTIVKIAKKFKNLSEHSKRMLADTYIILKEYKKALNVLNKMEYATDLKKALLLIKLKSYSKSRVLLEKAKENAINPKKINKILWFMAFTDLKTNKIERLKETLDLINSRKSFFKTNLELPLEIFFNKNKYTSKQYSELILNFNNDRKMDFVFYFAPFIFSDTQEIIYDIAKGFVYHQKENIDRLENMVDYNAKFLNVIKDDPILRVIKLKEISKTINKSYVFYNLALSYAQINDFHNAYKYFEKAFKLNPGNKLYASMMLIAAKKASIKVKDIDYVSTIIKNKDGLYNYFGKELYKIFINSKYPAKLDPIGFSSTIFYKALDFLKKKEEGKSVAKHPLLDKHIKDPFIYLLRLAQRSKYENDFSYYARLQDSVPLRLNDNFLEGPLIVTQYYADMLKAIGLFFKADLDIVGQKSPSYLRTQALKDLHFQKADDAIKTIEYLQNEYNLEDKYTMYLLVAALLEAGRYNDASIQISLIKAILNDSGADFLTAIQLIQELKISSAKQYLNEPYIDSLIDFKLVGLDEYLESL